VQYAHCPVFAAFGFGKKKDGDTAASQHDEPLVDLEDPELLNAMEIFANMSPEEMEETMRELKEMLGDDPEALAAMEQVMQEIPKMKADHIQSSLKELIEEDEIAAATQDALEMLRSGSFDAVFEKRNEILEAVIASGKIDAVDAARFQASPTAWEAELKHIWSELMKQANEASEKTEL